jgi:hypothetical protein
MAWNGTASSYSPDGRTRTFKPLRTKEKATARTGAILSVPNEELATAIGAVLSSGCALLLSPTSDGGALSICVYVGDQKHKGYATSAEEFAELLIDVRDLAESHMLRSTAPVKKMAQQAS